MPFIEAEHLVKTFHVSEREPGIGGALRGLFHRRGREVRALDGVSFAIREGEMLGYIGPNGAGKSTTVKVLGGILVPDSGTCTVMGRVPWKDRVAHVRTIGAVFGQRTQLWWGLPVVESFDLLRDIYGVAAAEHARVLAELVEVLELGPLLSTPVRQLSLGQRMRCDLAASLLHSPRILFLDEPTIGLDAPAKLAVRDFLRKLNREKGVTVLLPTHDLDDLEALCERVLLINHGRILHDGTLADLRRRVTGEKRVVLDLADDGRDVSDPDATVIRREGKRIHLSFDPTRVTASALISRLTANHPVRDLTVENPPIEEIIARIYKDTAA